jgi:hypothetical protein
MVLLMILPALALAAVAATRRRHRRTRWASPYAGFRAAAARVTRTGESSFRVAGAQMARSTPSQ